MSEKDRREKLFFPIPQAELERRHKAARAAMKTKGIDCLLMQNSTKYLGGYVRWFTDVVAENNFPVTVIFPMDDEMTMISLGGAPRPAFPPLWATYGVKEVLARPYYLSVNYTNTYDAKAAVETIKKLNAKRVGYVGPAFIPMTFDKYLTANLPGVEFVDMTEEIDRLKALKSDVEVEYIKKTAAVQDAVMLALPALIHPRMKVIEVHNIIQHILSDMGAEEFLLMLGTAPFGELAKHSSPYLQNKVIGEDDYMNIMIETNGPGGYYTEVARVFCMKEPPRDLLDLWDLNVKAQDRTVAKLIPGAELKPIYEQNNEFLVSCGDQPDTCVFAHGQGYDVMERPLIRPEEPIVIQPNMNIAVHPRLSGPTSFTFCCDNYLTTQGVPIRLHKTPREVFMIPH
ncbi:putative Peptidase, M24 family [uncultured spirochete]|jgi:Xaa-Pro aminopeptidase|uniref:Putative Peptidase, M24 family n=1 Tax=uncultured spirochete TaxID=156406 RepID=A0A3P3XQL1_9SPIR|nr:putative Peptidase, M24 family [uncultured spirochete]